MVIGYTVTDAWSAYVTARVALIEALTEQISAEVRAKYPTAKALRIETERGLEGWTVDVLDVLDIEGRAEPDHLEVVDEDLAREVEVDLKSIADVDEWFALGSSFVLSEQ
jgi:hypothetical protein